MLKATIKYTASTQSRVTGDFTSQFIAALETSGRMMVAEIYSSSNTLLYDSNTINSIKSSIDASLLKSLMRMYEIELNGLYILNDTVFSDIRIGVSADMGQTVYFVRLGKATVVENEQNLENQTTKIIAYDSMLAAMKPYALEIDYSSSTVYNRTFLQAIVTEMGLTLGTSIPSTGVMSIVRMQETYTQQYTYRDILDDFAEILGGCLVVKNDKLELLKPTSTNTTINEEQLITIKIAKEFKEVTKLILSRTPQEDNVADNIIDTETGEVVEGEEIRIEDNLLVEGYLVNGISDRTVYLDYIMDTLNSWGAYWTLELESYGYLLYEPCDLISVNLQDNNNDVTVDCLWLGADVELSQGLKENMKSIAPIAAKIDYSKATKESQKELETYLRVDKVSGDIESLASRTSLIEQDLTTQLLRMQTQVQQNAANIILSATETRQLLEGQITENSNVIDTITNRVIISAQDTKFAGITDSSYFQVIYNQLNLVVDGNTRFHVDSEGVVANSYSTGKWIQQEFETGSGTIWGLFKKGDS